jgi:nucleoside-diphosphate-sugar epimerase
MNLLITGASGFIGKHLINKLTNKHLVFGVSRCEILSDLKINLIEADLSKPEFTKKFPNNIDCVVHLAQSNKYRDFPEYAHDIHKININATFEILEWCRLNKIKKYILASTANVYSPSNDVFSETSPTFPKSFYGITKLCAENLSLQYQKFFQVNILRLFTVYGTGQKNMLISNIIEKIKLKKEIFLAKNIGLYLSPICVTDVAEIISKFAELPNQNNERIINICGDQIVTLEKIVNIIENILEYPAFTNITKDDPLFFTGKNLLLKQLFPKFVFKEIDFGLKELITHINSNNK